MKRATGSSCDRDEQCEGDLCITDKEAPGGYCSKVCATGQPGADDMCQQDELCTPLDGGVSICLSGCQSPTDCRQGYVCEDVLGGGACLPACTGDEECALGSVCELQSGRCVEDSAGSRVGSACESDAQCASGICLTEESSGWPGGTCISDCTGSTIDDFCDGQDAASGLCLEVEADFSACFPSCLSSNECRNGYVCTSEIGEGNDLGYGFCLPHCSNYDCEANEYCDVSGFCEVETTTNDQATTTKHLGSYSVRDDALTFVEITVPEGALSFSLSMETIGSLTTPLYVEKLVGPALNSIYDYNDPLTSKLSYGGGGEAIEGFTYPNAPSLRVTPGRYTFGIVADAPVDVEVSLHIKTGPSPQQGRFPLTLWFGANPYFDAATARNDPEFQQAVDRMKRIYADAGIEIAPIDYRDVAEPAASFYALPLIDVDPLAEIVTEMIGPAPGEGFHMVLVDQFLLDDGSGLYGISGGLPGAVGINQAPTLGVMTGLDIHFFEDGGLDVIELAATMSHELGHYLGLFHISEAEGTSHDPLDDTPECFDADGDGSVSGAECGSDGGSNMMYWSSDQDFIHERISPAQGWVMLRNPGVMH